MNKSYDNYSFFIGESSESTLVDTVSKAHETIQKMFNSLDDKRKKVFSRISANGKKTKVSKSIVSDLDKGMASVKKSIDQQEKIYLEYMKYIKKLSTGGNASSAAKELDSMVESVAKKQNNAIMTLKDEINNFIERIKDSPNDQHLVVFNATKYNAYFDHVSSIRDKYEKLLKDEDFKLWDIASNTKKDTKSPGKAILYYPYIRYLYQVKHSASLYIDLLEAVRKKCTSDK